MYDQPRANPSLVAMTFDQMLERVRYEGAYPTRERAEEAVRAVVSRLTGPDLLARILRRLPGGYALLFGQAELRQPQPAA